MASTDTRLLVPPEALSAGKDPLAVYPKVMKPVTPKLALTPSTVK